MEAFLLHIGINPADVFAAFTGGVCAAFATQGSRPTVLGVVSSIIVGTGVGSYGGPVIPAYLGLKPSGFATFAVGAAGLPIIATIRAAASRIKWSPVDKKIKAGE